MMDITLEEKLAFSKVYKQEDTHTKISEGHDIHQDFADILSIDRQAAKVLFYRINYTLYEGEGNGG